MSSSACEVADDCGNAPQPRVAIDLGQGLHAALARHVEVEQDRAGAPWSGTLRAVIDGEIRSRKLPEAICYLEEGCARGKVVVGLARVFVAPEALKVMRSFVALAGFALFVLVLLYTTLRSTRTPLGQSAEDRAAAQRVCWTLVRDQISEARFPSAANVEARGVDRLRLSGSVDAGATRRNYACSLRHTESGGYVADSVVVWQSH